MEKQDRARRFGENLSGGQQTAGREDENGTNSSPRAQAFLQPIAAPSVLGLYGFAGATFMVAANLAGWYGNASTPEYLAPFAAVFGGLAQFLAGMWAYKARDGIATAMHGMWGSFWIGYGILFTMAASDTLRIPSGAFVPFGYWFIVLGAITFVGAFAAMGENLALASVLHTLWIGSGALAVGLLVGSTLWETVAGWILILSAVLAWYTASAMMFEGMGRAILPVGKTRKAREKAGFSPGAGEPGVIHGQ